MSEAMAIREIEQKRMAMNISKVRLCAVADVGRQTYREALAGTATPSPRTISRLNLALRRFHIGFASEAGNIAPHGAFKACLVLVALVMGGDVKAAVLAKPSRRATGSAEWQEAARLRQIAYSVANQFLGFSQVDVARAAGVTRAAVHEAIKKLENERDTDADLDRIMTTFEEIFSHEL